MLSRHKKSLYYVFSVIFFGIFKLQACENSFFFGDPSAAYRATFYVHESICSRDDPIFKPEEELKKEPWRAVGSTMGWEGWELYKGKNSKKEDSPHDQRKEIRPSYRHSTAVCALQEDSDDEQEEDEKEETHRNEEDKISNTENSFEEGDVGGEQAESGEVTSPKSPSKKPKKKQKKGSLKKKKSPMEASSSPAFKSSAPQEPIILEALTADAFPTIDVKFLYSTLGNLDAKSDSASGYTPTIRYQLDTVKHSITRATNIAGVDLLRIRTPDFVLTSGDRIFSLKGKDRDFLLRNGNAIYPLFEDGWTDTDEELPIEGIVQIFQEMGIPPYRQLSPGEIRRYLPDEKKTLTNTFFYLQAAAEEHVIVRVNEQRQCRAMTPLTTVNQREAFEEFREFHNTCPIFIVKTEKDMQFIQDAENFEF